MKAWQIILIILVGLLITQISCRESGNYQCSTNKILQNFDFDGDFLDILSGLLDSVYLSYPIEKGCFYAIVLDKQWQVCGYRLNLLFYTNFSPPNKNLNERDQFEPPFFHASALNTTFDQWASYVDQITPIYGVIKFHEKVNVKFLVVSPDKTESKITFVTKLQGIYKHSAPEYQDSEPVFRNMSIEMLP